MPEDLVEALARTLRRAADAAPPPPRDLAAQVNARYQRRQGTFAALAAALAVLAVLAASMGVARAVSGPAPVAGPRKPIGLAQIGKLHALPARVGGEEYTLLQRLPDGRFLATSQRQSGKSASAKLLLLTVPDSGLVNFEVLYEVFGTTDRIPTIDYATAGNDRWVAFVLSLRSTRDSQTTLYRLDLAPGVQVKALVKLKNAEINALATESERVYYRQIDPSGATVGLRSVPATGGASSPLSVPPLRDEFNAQLFWPWLLAGANRGQEGSLDDYQVINLVTGEVKTARFHGTYGADFCTAQWCETGGVATNTPGVTLQRFDGTGKQFFPGFKIHQQQTGHSSLLLNRYLPAIRGEQLFLLDAATGQQIPLLKDASGQSYENTPDFVLIRNGARLWVFMPG